MSISPDCNVAFGWFQSLNSMISAFRTSFFDNRAASRRISPYGPAETPTLSSLSAALEGVTAVKSASPTGRWQEGGEEISCDASLVVQAWKVSREKWTPAIPEKSGFNRLHDRSARSTASMKWNCECDASERMSLGQRCPLMDSLSAVHCAASPPPPASFFRGRNRFLRAFHFWTIECVSRESLVDRCPDPSATLS